MGTRKENLQCDVGSVKLFRFTSATAFSSQVASSEGVFVGVVYIPPLIDVCSFSLASVFAFSTGERDLGT